MDFCDINPRRRATNFTLNRLSQWLILAISLYSRDKGNRFHCDLMKSCSSFCSKAKVRRKKLKIASGLRQLRARYRTIQIRGSMYKTEYCFDKRDIICWRLVHDGWS